jgi:hypothetical protein
MPQERGTRTGPEDPLQSPGFALTSSCNSFGLVGESPDIDRNRRRP